MESRRNFLKLAITVIGLGLNCSFSGIRWAWAETKKIILPRGTERGSLIGKNPAELDARNLEVTPLKDFGTMGLTDHDVNLDRWRLQITGNVRKSLSLSYSQIRGLPSIERNVLLICPGFFANHGIWRGISIRELLQRADLRDGVTHVTIRGPKGPYEKAVRYTLDEVLADKVFLAYQVNGKDLPRKHGFPIRAVAEDHYGYDWVKYVSALTVEGKG
jgi:DMSO/TMAO reductase YedYZ molybdopterin-dependent catalytic subunit